MPDFPAAPNRRAGTISTLSPENCRAGWMSILGQIALNVSTAWVAADRAIFVPVRLQTRATVYQLSTMNGATASGTTDIGIYNEDFARLVSTGPQTQTGTSTIQTFDVTDTKLNPGIYFLALLNSGTTGTYLMGTQSVIRNRMCGMLSQSSVASSTLPDPAVPVSVINSVVPVIVAHLKATV